MRISESGHSSRCSSKRRGGDRILMTGICLSRCRHWPCRREVSSVYTDLNSTRTARPSRSTRRAASSPNFVCNGSGGYPVLDLFGRPSRILLLRFSQSGDLAPAGKALPRSIQPARRSSGGSPRTAKAGPVRHHPSLDRQRSRTMRTRRSRSWSSRRSASSGSRTAAPLASWATGNPQGERDRAQDRRQAGPRLRLRRRRARAGRRADAAIRSTGELNGRSRGATVPA